MEQDNWPIYPEIFFKYATFPHGFICQFRTRIRKKANDGRWYKQRIMDEFVQEPAFTPDDIIKWSRCFHANVYRGLVAGEVDLNQAWEPTAPYDARGGLFTLDTDQSEEKERLLIK